MRVVLELKDCFDKFGKVEEWIRHQVMCDLGDSSGHMRLALDLGNSAKLSFI